MNRIDNILGDNIGFVELLDSMGSDLTIVNAARVTYNRESLVWTDKDRDLLESLLASKHGTPFEHVVFSFRVRAPIFVTREWMRHRMGSYNEVSARRHRMEPEFYAPTPTIRDEVLQQYAAYRFILSEEQVKGTDPYRAKELARNVLPVSIYTTFWWTVNLRSLLNFLMLRNHDEAQPEIREYARAVEDVVAMVVPITHEVFVNHGRVAP